MFICDKKASVTTFQTEACTQRIQTIRNGYCRISLHICPETLPLKEDS